jgi:hypothetical protein
MKNIGLGQIIQILANLGVLAGLVLLAFELDQNRQIMKAQIRHELAQVIVHQRMTMATDEGLTELVARVRSASPDLSEIDMDRYVAFVNSRFRYWEDVHYQYRNGLYDESEFDAQTRAWKLFVMNESTKEIWQRTRGNYSPEFANEIDGLISD